MISEQLKQQESKADRYYLNNFYITRSIRRAQGNRQPSNVLPRTTHSKRVRVKRSRRNMQKASRQRNRH